MLSINKANRFLLVATIMQESPSTPEKRIIDLVDCIAEDPRISTLWNINVVWLVAHHKRENTRIEMQITPEGCTLNVPSGSGNATYLSRLLPRMMSLTVLMARIEEILRVA